MLDIRPVDVPLFIGAVLLLYIAIELVMPKDHGDESKIKASDTLMKAVTTIAIADVVMSHPVSGAPSPLYAPWLTPFPRRLLRRI